MNLLAPCPCRPPVVRIEAKVYHVIRSAIWYAMLLGERDILRAIVGSRAEQGTKCCYR